MEESQSAKKKCCFCVPLRVGLLSLAYYNLVLGLVFFWDPFLPFATRIDAWSTAFDQELRRAVAGMLLLPLIVDVVFAVVLLYGLHKLMMRMDIIWARQLRECCYLLPLIVDVVFAMVLLNGLQKNDALVLYGYMWYAVISIVSMIYICCVTIFEFYSPVEAIVTMGTSVLFQTFIFILVWKYRQEINQTLALADNKLPFYKQQEADGVESGSSPQPSAPTQVNVSDATVEKTLQ